MAQSSHYKPGDKIGGRYLVHKALMGGMGEVYLCLDTQHNYPIALKTFQSRFLINDDLRNAFAKEVATWVALEKHPNIVRCFYMETIDNRPFMFLEWVASDGSHGTDLRSWLSRGPLDHQLALDFVIDVCRGLIHAGRKQPGIVHRDLKPENILVSQEQLAKITDFGLAKVLQDAHLSASPGQTIPAEGLSFTSVGGGSGTPLYMAPEQWRAESLDRRTDIYALGCILYEVLTGQWPFDAHSVDDLRDLHLNAEIPVLAGNDTFISEINHLLPRCMAKLKEDRYSTDDLLQELARVYQKEFGRPPRDVVVDEGFTSYDYSNRGVTYNNLGLYDKALEDYNRAIQLNPGDPYAYSNRGNTYYSLQQYDEALADHNRGLRLNPNFSNAYLNRGNVFRDLKRDGEALADYDRVLQIDPTDALAYNNRGTVKERLERYEEALEDLGEAIRLDPNNAKFYSNRAKTYIEMRRFDLALADCNTALRLDPTLDKTYALRGNSYYELQRYQEALKDLTQAIRLGVEDSYTYNGRGATYRALARYQDALADLNRAIDLDPNGPEAYINRGNAYLGLRQYDKAIKDFTHAISLDPNRPEAYFNRASAYDQLQRANEAIADYSSAIEIAPDFMRAYPNRGIAYTRLQRYAEARADFERAILLDPNHAPNYFNFGMMFVARGEWHEALPRFEKAAHLGLQLGTQYARLAKEKMRGSP
jgi:tetratricopeptide (TPR) repeat protein